MSEKVSQERVLYQPEQYGSGELLPDEAASACGRGKSGDGRISPSAHGVASVRDTGGPIRATCGTASFVSSRAHAVGSAVSYALGQGAAMISAIRAPSSGESLPERRDARSDSWLRCF
jgi:hypothetical protein